MRVASTIFGWGAAAMLVACSSSEHPPAADFAGEVPAPALVTDAGTGEPTSEGGSTEECPARTKRECMTAFYTLGGKLQACKQSFQWCRADGKGWHNCGFSVDKPPD